MITTEDFLRLLFKFADTGFIGVTFLGSDLPTLTKFRPLPLPRIDTPLDLSGVMKMNARGYNCYFRVMVQFTAHEPKTVFKDNKPFTVYPRGKTNESIMTRVLWAEIDYQDTSPENAVKAIELLPHYPSIVVSSGGGLHCYWLLRQVLVTHEAQYTGQLRSLYVEADELKRTLKGIGKAIGCADPKVAELARIMRLPGTVNTKPGRANALCEVIDMRGGDYDYRDLELTYAPLIQKTAQIQRTLQAPSSVDDLPRWLQDYLVSGAPQGERNATLSKAAYVYHGRGRSQADAERDLGARASADGLEDHEIERTINSAYRAVVGVATNYQTRRVSARDKGG